MRVVIGRYDNRTTRSRCRKGRIMKDYEFLRWLADYGTYNGGIILRPDNTRQLRAIADQIERLSNTTDESLHCTLTCGHNLWLFEPTIGKTVTCRVCHNPVTVAKIWFKEPTQVKRRVCTLLCGHALYVDSPRMGADAYCSACVAMYRIVSIHRDY